MRTSTTYDEAGHGQHDEGGWQVLRGRLKGRPRVLLWSHDADDPVAVAEVALTLEQARQLGQALLDAADQPVDGLGLDLVRS